MQLEAYAHHWGTVKEWVPTMNFDDRRPESHHLNKKYQKARTFGGYDAQTWMQYISSWHGNTTVGMLTITWLVQMDVKYFVDSQVYSVDDSCTVPMKLDGCILKPGSSSCLKNKS